LRITVVRSQPKVAANASYEMLGSAAIRASTFRCRSVKGAFIGALPRVVGAFSAFTGAFRVGSSRMTAVKVQDETPLELRPGDFVNIPAHTRHRVEWTTPDEPTVWLAVH